MSAEGEAQPDTRVLDDLIRGLEAAGFSTKVLVDPLPEVVVFARDPRLDPWDDPDPDRQIEVVRIQHHDGQLHCPWLPGPVPDSEVDEVGSILKTLMDTRGY